jgi:photosystem II stability/assembly factor-like uncharacterized protein
MDNAPQVPEQAPEVSSATQTIAPAEKTVKIKKKWLIIGGGLLALIVVVVLILTFTKGGEKEETVTANTAGYVFLSMGACNKHFQEAGYNANVVNTTCQRLEQELITKQASGSTDFEPMPLECNDPIEDQWYRTDNTFVIDHENPDTMYVNVEWKGFHKSTDGGATWTLKTKNIIVDHKDINTGKPCYGEYPVAIIDPNDAQRILLATSGGGGGTLSDQNMRGGGVYETTDGAETWTQKISSTMNGYTTHALVFDPSNSQSFYYGTAASPASYTEADPNKIWVTKGLIYKTPDNGKTWEELPTGFIKNTRLMSIMLDSRNTQKITAATNVILRNASGPNTISEEQMGIIQSLDGGATWKRIDNLPKGYEATYQAGASTANPDLMYFIPSVNGGGKPKNFYSLDGGATWSESNKMMDMFAYDPNDPTGKRMLGYYWQCYGSTTCSKTLYESTDAGKTWNTFGTLPAEAQDLENKKSRIQTIVWHPKDKNTFYLTGAGALIWKTTDNGASWTKLLSLEKL